MDFPKNATKEERLFNWSKIAEISDADFGFDTDKPETNQIRFNTRIFLANDQGEICVIKSENHGYLQLPGGGIEEQENIIEGLRRETEEETGWLIKNIKPLGYTIEHRENTRNSYAWNQTVSFVFTASPDQEVGTKYMPDEIAEGFMPIWIKPEDFITEQLTREGHITSYSGNFATRRDILITKYFLNLP